MLPVKSILVPTDFSTNAEKAFETGLEVCRAASARLYLLHVRDASLFGAPYIPEGGFVYPIEEADIFKKLEEMKAQHPDVEMEVSGATGNPSDEIVAFADEKKVDLICISTHGRTGLSRLLGSTTEAVVRKAHCPVLSVRGTAPA